MTMTTITRHVTPLKRTIRVTQTGAAASNPALTWLYLLMQSQEETVQLRLQDPAAHVDRRFEDVAQALFGPNRKLLASS